MHMKPAPSRDVDRKRRRPTRRSVVFKLQAALIGIVLAVLVMEIGLRLFAKQPGRFAPPPENKLTIDHPTRGLSMRPDANENVYWISIDRRTNVRTNALGFRGPPIDDSPQHRRVLAIGDSFTMGWGLEERDAWPTLLPQMLRQNHPDFPPIEVING